MQLHWSVSLYGALCIYNTYRFHSRENRNKPYVPQHESLYCTLTMIPFDAAQVLIEAVKIQIFHN